MLSSHRKADIKNDKSQAKRAPVLMRTNHTLNSRPQLSDPLTLKQGMYGTTVPAQSAGDGHAEDFDGTPESSPQDSALAKAMAWLRDMTIFKAILIIYCLNIVAWGGMIFLLLCNASPAMCYPTCNDINSPRRKWIEIDSQILNALFCVPAFGLFPRRALQAWQLLQFVVRGDLVALRCLAGRYRTWFRLPGSQMLPASVGPDEVENWLSLPSATLNILPLPVRRIPDAPPTGQRAATTSVRMLGAVIGLNMMNTVFQAILSGFMWGYSRHSRPGWSVGLFLCLAFAASTGAGVLEFLEGKKVRRVEGRYRRYAFIATA
ncbi:unnamed protein product [Clonostachys solani]|uniref:Uncharacterized protein n=1 Tax=Clonostachys solani TaxID=160281 RepID=A0A9N9ZIL9_9HYPO|nr:unnamed protein product [Clonostachys solani]